MFDGKIKRNYIRPFALIVFHHMHQHIRKQNMRLSHFIRSHQAPIVSEWINFAQTMTPASDAMTRLELRDHINEILSFIADDLESTQTAAEQIIKSHGDGPKKGGLMDSAAETHAACSSSKPPILTKAGGRSRSRTACGARTGRS